MRTLLFLLVLTLAACADDAPDSNGAAAEDGPELSFSQDLRSLPASEVRIGAAGVSGGSATGSGTTATTSAVRSSNAAVQRVFSEFNARQTSSGIVLSLPENVLFGFDEYALRSEARTALSKIMEVLAEYPDAPVEVVGHTDSRGADDYNQTLSERRAESVVAWLTEQGVSASRLSATGRGASDPVAPNETPAGEDNPEGREQNRRVEVLLEGVTGTQEEPSGREAGEQPTSTIQSEPAS